MRADMVKVIVERERRGGNRNYHWARSRKKFKDKDIEEAITYESMNKRHSDRDGMRKELNENLNPLRNFLYRQVGRPWDKVYSELNQFVNVKNAVQAHIRQHLYQFVELHAVKDDNGNYRARGRYGSQHLLNDGELFVNESGILCKAKRKSEKVRLLPGQKLYTMYWHARCVDSEYPYYYNGSHSWICDRHCVKHETWLAMEKSKYIFHAMTFIVCRHEDIDIAKKELGTTCSRLIKDN